MCIRDSYCASCSSSSEGACTSCTSPYSLSSGTCVSTCAEGCLICSDSTTCLLCSTYYYLNFTSALCTKCPNIPACLTCSSSDPTICNQCNSGFYMNNNTCLPCPSYCASCSSATLCLSLAQTTGYILMLKDEKSNYPAICDPGCEICSSSNPSICTDCKDGYYLTL